MATKSIPIKDIRIDGGTQQRPLDKKVVNHYAERRKEGDNFPVIEIIFDGKSYFLWDGAHRLAAARKLNKNHILANVENGTQRDAIKKSFSANKTNAFPRQPGTLKKIVEKILKDSEWSKMSPKVIADLVGCTERYVFKIQKALKKLTMNSSVNKPPSKSQKQLFRADTRTVKRDKSEYEAKVPEKIVLDSTGKQVPVHLVKYFERANEYRGMIKQLNDMLKTVRDGKNADDLFYRYIKIENLTAEVGNVKRIFRFARPFAVCRYCGADENNDECRACNGCGFVNEMTYKATPEDLK